MIIGMSFIACSFIYTLLLCIVNFSKKRINTIETQIYNKLLLLNLIGLALEFLCCLTVKNMDQVPVLNIAVNRLYLIYFASFITLFTLYIYIVCNKASVLNSGSALKLTKKEKRITVFAYAILLAGVIILPLNYHSDPNAVYSYGPAADILSLFCSIYMLMDFISIGKNIKKLNKKKLIPMFALLVCFVFAFIIRNINPGIILITCSFALVTAIMYFTIENPDIQLLSELYKNKKLIERSNEDTSNFLFKMTQDIKKPVNDMLALSKDLIKENDAENMKEIAKDINNKSKELDFAINDILDVSLMDTKRIKIYDSRYNVLNVFKEIKYRMESEMPKNVEFEFETGKNLPDYLYGDAIKLKQVLNSILNNAIKNTVSGYISMDVSAISKYGVCRLIITISDTGKGMDIEEINDILSLKIEDLQKIDLRNSDGKILNLKAVKKLLSLLGGNLMLKSDEKGTVVTVVLEQKIVENEEKAITKKLDTYEQTLYNNKRIMVVDDDAKELTAITNKLEKLGASVSGSLFGKDCIEKIASKIKYNLIILDDETSTYSAYDVLKELKKNEKFSTPVVVMIDDKKAFIRLHYLQDGFADCIMKSKLESEIERIMKRF